DGGSTRAGAEDARGAEARRREPRAGRGGEPATRSRRGRGQKGKRRGAGPLPSSSPRATADGGGGPRGGAGGADRSQRVAATAPGRGRDQGGAEELSPRRPRGSSSGLDEDGVAGCDRAPSEHPGVCAARARVEVVVDAPELAVGEPARVLRTGGGERGHLDQCRADRQAHSGPDRGPIDAGARQILAG